jgi:uncharacterized protein YmfQ (DUF2313 family)
MPTTADKVKRLTQRLLPTGRAWKMPPNGTFDRLVDALKVSEAQAVADAIGLLDAILPDNDNFTADDATQWERRLGMIVNTSTPLADRKAAIRRKMNHPGTIPARQHYLYIEGQLQAAGFDVWVHENIPTVDPVAFGAAGLGDIGQLGTYELGDGELGDGSDIIFNTILTQVQLGTFQLGQAQLGWAFNNKVANNIDPALDLYFDTGINYRSSFFVGGQVYGTFADVAASRESEFRQLILQLKQANTVAFIYINYV